MQEYQEIQIDETDALEGRRTPLWRDRLFVFVFLLSVCACLVALWLSGIILSLPDQGWFTPFLQFVTMHRWLVLLIPAVCLLGCYGVLRSLTGEVMAVPERYLDERQQVLRNQAHRSAFKLIKLACILIPVCFFLIRLPVLNAAPTTSWASVYKPNVSSVYILSVPDNGVASFKNPYLLSLMDNKLQLHYTQVVHPMYGMYLSIPPVTTTDIVLAGGLLLLCVWLLISALPMCVLAWQGRR